MTTAMCHVNYVHTVMVIMYMIHSKQRRSANGIGQ